MKRGGEKCAQVDCFQCFVFEKKYFLFFHFIMENTTKQCYRPSPPWVVKKRCALNVRTEDDNCFAWVLLRARYPVPQHKRRQVEDLYWHLNELVLPPNVSFPIPLDKTVFQQIEALNPWCSFSVFLIGEEEGNVQAFYISRQRGQRPLHVCVGALQHPSSTQTAHYISIRQLEVLIGKTCEKCLQMIRYCDLSNHEKTCGENNSEK